MIEIDKDRDGTEWVYYGDDVVGYLTYSLEQGKQSICFVLPIPLQKQLEVLTYLSCTR